MADGDLSMTVTVMGASVPTLVTGAIDGSGADDLTGRLPRSRGATGQDFAGTDAQEAIGRSSRGENGTVS